MVPGMWECHHCISCIQTLVFRLFLTADKAVKVAFGIWPASQTNLSMSRNLLLLRYEAHPSCCNCKVRSIVPADSVSYSTGHVLCSYSNRFGPQVFWYLRHFPDPILKWVSLCCQWIGKLLYSLETQWKEWSFVFQLSCQKNMLEPSPTEPDVWPDSFMDFWTIWWVLAAEILARGISVVFSSDFVWI